ncbi:MAG: hypothetical protein ACU0A6_04135 [Shimia sp.]|uniref:hypothetical protein n=1 Tax=Shimia sp. TaxID=1954381 RepID=UPI00405A372F
MPDSSHLFPFEEDSPEVDTRSLPQEVMDYFDDIAIAGEAERMAPGWWVLPAMCAMPAALIALVWVI